MNTKKAREVFKQHSSLLPLFLISIFGFGYQAVPVLSWFFIPILLTYTRYRSRWRILAVYITMILGSFLAYLGSLRDTLNGPRYPNLGLIFGAILFNSTLVILVNLGDHFVTSNRNCVSTRTYFFSTMWTVVWYFNTLFFGFGDYFSPTVALVNWPDFAQLAALGGRPLLDFIFAIFGTSILELSAYPVPALSLFIGRLDTTVLVENEEGLPEQEEEEHLTKKSAFKILWVHPVTKFVVLVSLLLVYGGARVNIHDRSLYQSSYSEYLPPTVPVGCVVGPGNDYPELAKQQDIWLDKSKSLIEAGAKLVLWSEITTVVNNEEEEAEFLDKVKDLAISSQVYIAVAYRRLEPNANKLVFVLKNGTIGIDYKKAHPAPGEPQPPGPHVVPYVDTEDFGRVGGAICFDYNFPRFISQASAHKIDLMLQPSWTWGPIGTYHEQSNILRAVENGFTLVRCVSQGISGVFEPTLNSVYNQKVATLNNEKYLFTLPIQKRVATLYSYIGNVLVYICLALGTFIFSFIANTVRKNRKLAI